MTADAIARYIAETFNGIDLATAPNGDQFFFYDPKRDLPHDRRMPFVTIVASDAYDRASNLSRPGVFRLNIGVAKESYRSLFGAPPPFPKDGGIVDTGHDFTVIDRVLPHPVYAAMSWVCILSPSDATFESTVKSLLAEAHAVAAEKRSRGSSPSA